MNDMKNFKKKKWMKKFTNELIIIHQRLFVGNLRPKTPSKKRGKRRKLNWDKTRTETMKSQKEDSN